MPQRPPGPAPTRWQTLPPGRHRTQSRGPVPTALYPVNRTLCAGPAFNSALPRPQAGPSPPTHRAPPLSGPREWAIPRLPAEKPRRWRLQPLAWVKEPESRGRDSSEPPFCPFLPLGTWAKSATRHLRLLKSETQGF